MNESGYPFLLYVYNAEGRYGAPGNIPTALGLKLLFETTVKPAVERGLKVVITDCDDFCVFHAEGGEVVFPKPEDIQGRTS